MIKRMSMLLLIALSFSVVLWQSPSGFAQTVMEKQSAEKNGKDDPKGDDEKAAAALPNFPPPGGIAIFSNGTYDCRGTTYTYRITFAPPDNWGKLHINRNGNEENTDNWIKTDANGSASRSWPVTTDQTGLNIYVQWEDGTRTTPRTKVDDYTPPTVNIYPGAPYTFSGNATDVRWGSGFGSWTTMPVTFRNTTTGLYWNGSCYCSPTPPASPPKANFVVSSDGFSLTWSINPPPLSAHVPGESYKWTVTATDRCAESPKASYPFTF